MGFNGKALLRVVISAAVRVFLKTAFGKLEIKLFERGKPCGFSLFFLSFAGWREKYRNY